MSKRAEERALEAYPDVKKEDGYDLDTEIWVTQNLPLWRKSFIKGYEQAEKDLELTADDIEEIIHIYEITVSIIGEKPTGKRSLDEEYYERILDEYKRRKNIG